LFKLAMESEKIALNEDHFVSRELYPNVDFYSGIVQSALCILISLLTGICHGPHNWLDRAVERDDRRPGTEDRASAPAGRGFAASRHAGDG